MKQGGGKTWKITMAKLYGQVTAVNYEIRVGSRIIMNGNAEAIHRAITILSMDCLRGEYIAVSQGRVSTNTS